MMNMMAELPFHSSFIIPHLSFFFALRVENFLKATPLFPTATK